MFNLEIVILELLLLVIILKNVEDKFGVSFGEVCRLFWVFFGVLFVFMIFLVI